jgi:hypothetical protein
VRTTSAAPRREDNVNMVTNPFPIDHRPSVVVPGWGHAPQQPLITGLAHHRAPSRRQDRRRSPS